jgi:hypothetical protein
MHLATARSQTIGYEEVEEEWVAGFLFTGNLGESRWMKLDVNSAWSTVRLQGNERRANRPRRQAGSDLWRSATLLVGLTSQNAGPRRPRHHDDDILFLEHHSTCLNLADRDLENSMV